MEKQVIQNGKVVVIGAGFVGASIAYAMNLQGIAKEIALIDIDDEKAEGEVWDIRHGLSRTGNVHLYAGDYSDCADCSMIIIAVGRNRQKGESRLDLTAENIRIVYSVVNSIKPYYVHGIILVVSNPVDIITYKVNEWMGLPNGMVFGSGCLLDTSRLIRLIADYVGVNTDVVDAYVIGEHGDDQVIVWSRVAIGGMPIEEYCSNVSLAWNREVKFAIAEKTREMGAEIIRRKGKTNFGIATCVCYLADAILKKKIITASVTSPLLGEYGISGVALSVPSLVGADGVHQRLKENWSTEEYKNFLNAGRKVREILNHTV